MSGHSKWATIKRSKGKADEARGKVFSRLIREITIAARMGGGDKEGNPRLRSAITSARAANMPGKNIDNAIAKGTGTLEGVNFEEMNMEGFAPGGVALLVECMSDNRNRTVSEVRHAMSKGGGNLGAANSVSWMFKAKGVIHVAKTAMEEDALMEIVLEAGAEDMIVDGDEYEITSPIDKFEDVRTALEKAAIAIVSAETAKIAENTVKLEGESAFKVMRLLDELDSLDDTQHVYSNIDISDEDAEKYANME
ncbi:MAG TPA: YebC/PmpR family DNA-binding transcriptional regulator [Fibrobacteres bacterium]|nr:YebC/PmpR family DNA-binding transcriptional regulator [Fibrobacterota bacterium]